MDLAAVGAHGAAGFGAAAVAGDEHDALGGGGDASGTEEIQCLSGGLVEDRQPVVGVAGQADDVADGHHGAAAGNSDPGTGFEVLQGGANDDRRGQSVVLAQFAGFECVAPNCDQRVVLTLREAAVVVVDLSL